MRVHDCQQSVAGSAWWRRNGKSRRREASRRRRRGEQRQASTSARTLRAHPARLPQGPAPGGSARTASCGHNALGQGLLPSGCWVGLATKPAAAAAVPAACEGRRAWRNWVAERAGRMSQVAHCVATGRCDRSALPEVASRLSSPPPIELRLVAATVLQEWPRGDQAHVSVRGGQQHRLGWRVGAENASAQRWQGGTGGRGGSPQQRSSAPLAGTGCECRGEWQGGRRRLMAAEQSRAGGRRAGRGDQQGGGAEGHSGAAGGRRPLMCRARRARPAPSLPACAPRESFSR